MMKKLTLITTAFLAAAAGSIAHAQAPFPGSDEFAGASRDVTKWGAPISEGSALLTQSGGVLKFSSVAGDADSFMAWPWLAPGPMETGWSIQVDVNVPVIPLAEGHTAAGMAIAVRNSEDPTDMFSMNLENVRSPGQPQQFNFFNDVQIDDNTNEISTPGTPGKVAGLRITWHADTQVLTAEFDPNGPTDGYSWTILNSFNPIAGWLMTPGAPFEIMLGAYAEATVVAATKNFYADNFRASNFSPSNLLGSDNFNDNSRNPAKWGEDASLGVGSFAETSGRLEYVQTETDFGGVMRPWIAGTGSLTSDWEAFVDVHLGDITNPDGNAQLGLEVANGVSMATVQLTLTKDTGNITREFAWQETGPGGGSDTAVAPNEDAALRVAFDADTKVLSFHYDADGSTNGYAWTELGSVDVDDPNADWGLAADSRFLISLSGGSSSAVAAGDMYADNFNGLSDYVPTLGSSPTGFDDFAGNGKNIQKWNGEFQEGTGEFTQYGDGVLRFTSSGTGEEMRAWLWQANGLFSASWSIQSDVHVPVIPLGGEHRAAGLGIAVLNSADETDNFTAALENYTSGPGSPQEFHFLSTLDTNDTGAPEIFAPASSTLGAVRIAWNHTTKSLTAAYDADGPVNGYSWTVFRTFNPATGGWNMGTSNSFRIAIYGSSEDTEVTLNHGVYADNFYVFGGLTTQLPVVKTIAATGISATGATLNGSVDAKGSPRAVSFDYGLTTAYGSTIAATPASVGGTGVTAVNAPLSNLLPHTKYNFRVRAGNALGTALGSNMTFTTANRLPTPVADNIAVLPGAIAALPVLLNDTDPDNDTLSIASFGSLTPSSAGKLSKTGNQLVFTASSSFNGATFTYTPKDGFGGSGPLTTVTLTRGSCDLSHGQAFPVPSAGVTYPVDVDATGSWSVVENLSWVSATPLAGTDDGTVQITLQPNASLSARSGTVMIGGKPHTITQAGVLAPQIALNQDPPPPAMVGAFYTLGIDITNAPVVFTVTNLPGGLSLNKDTGLISGYPTKAGSFTVTVKAKNAAGNAPDLPSFVIDVEPMETGLVGAFHGLIAPDGDINHFVGSRLELTVTSVGGVTGKIITGTTPQPLNGRLNLDVFAPSTPTLTLGVPNNTNPVLVLELNFDSATNSFFGTYGPPGAAAPAPVMGWRNPWTSTHKPTGFAGPHSFSIEPVFPDPALPAGFGFGSFTPNGTTGMAIVAGKLADGTAFTSSSFVSELGELLVYSPLYGNKGTFCGDLQINVNGDGTTDNDVLGSMMWFKPPTLPPAKDLIHPAGFPPTEMMADGGGVPVVLGGEIVMGLSNPPTNAQLQFSGGLLGEEGEVDAEAFTVTFDILNPSATGTANKATFPDGEEHHLTMPTLNTGTGAFSGEFTLHGATTAENRKVPYQGMIVRLTTGEIVGRGYSLVPMPIFPPIITAANAFKFSSKVVLSPAP